LEFVASMAGIRNQLGSSMMLAWIMFLVHHFVFQWLALKLAASAFLNSTHHSVSDVHFYAA
jgi:hypothetical protein